MPDRKINSCSKFSVKLFRATIANADIRSLKSLHTLFDTYLDHMLVKFLKNIVWSEIYKILRFLKKKTGVLKPFLTKRWRHFGRRFCS